MSGPSKRKASPAAAVLIAPIRFYQRFITPYTPATCRFYPTCSTFAVTALREHGAVRGFWLALRRLGRCHPWSEGGVDHVPLRRERNSRSSSSVTVHDAIAQPTGRPFIDAASGASIIFPARLRAVAPPTDRSTAA